MAETTAIRSVMSGLTLRSGMLSSSGKLFNIEASETSTKLISLCRECGAEHPTRVSERYICANGHGPFRVAEDDVPMVLKGVELNKQIHYVGTVEEVDALKDISFEFPFTSKDSRMAPWMDMVLVPADTLNAVSYPQGGSYVFVPNNAANDQFYGLLRSIVGPDGIVRVDGDRLTFLGRLPIRGSAPKEYRLQTWRDYLVLQAMVKPAAIKPIPESPAMPPNPAALAQLSMLLSPYRAALPAMADEIGAKIDAFVVDRLANPTSSPELPAVPKVDQLTAALEASLAAVKTANKPRRTRAPRAKKEG